MSTMELEGQLDILDLMSPAEPQDIHEIPRLLSQVESHTAGVRSGNFWLARTATIVEAAGLTETLNLGRVTHPCTEEQLTEWVDEAEPFRAQTLGKNMAWRVWAHKRNRHDHQTGLDWALARLAELGVKK